MLIHRFRVLEFPIDYFGHPNGLCRSIRMKNLIAFLFTIPSPYMLSIGHWDFELYLISTSLLGFSIVHSISIFLLPFLLFSFLYFESWHRTIGGCLQISFYINQYFIYGFLFLINSLPLKPARKLRYFQDRISIFSILSMTVR